MKRIFAVIISMTLFFALALPSFAALAPQDMSCTAGFVGGDVDGDGKVTSADAAQLMQYLTGWSIPGDASHADTLRDGVVNAKDAAKLMQYLAGWNVGRLCHDDEYVTVKDSTVMEQGMARYTCRVCGDFVEETIPYKTYTVCGTDITEYKVLYGTNGMSWSADDRILGIMNATCDALLGGYYDLTPASPKNKTGKMFEHEILIGDVSMFKRDGLPDFSDGQPCYGVTEDGTIYFHTTNTGLLGDMWLEMLRDRLNVDFHLVNNVEYHVELESYDENGGDVQPFSRTYEPFDLEAEGYELVFADEFDGDSVDWDVWKLFMAGKYKDYGLSESQVTVRNGGLHITAEYREDGQYGPGWYTAYVSLRKLYSRGYYEARIDCAENHGSYSAFWLQGQSPYVPADSQGGLGWGGCEIDILELFNNTSVTYNLYAAGGKGSVKDTYESYNSDYYAIGDLTGDYHVYALEWDEDFYSFYIDGRLVGRTAFADGTSDAEETLIFSMCCTDSTPEDTSIISEMVVDYIRIYQK